MEHDSVLKGAAKFLPEIYYFDNDPAAEEAKSKLMERVIGFSRKKLFSN